MLHVQETTRDIFWRLPYWVQNGAPVGTEIEGHGTLP